MSKRTNIALLTLAAFLLLGVSITANAGQPKPEKDQYLISPALFGKKASCSVLNVTDSTLEAGVKIMAGDGVTVLSDWLLELASLEAYTAGMGDEDSQTFYCTVSWFGLAGDIKASFCRYSDIYYVDDVACVNFD